MTVFLVGIIPAPCLGVQITESEPADDEEDVSVNSWIIIRFNTTMKLETVDIEIKPSLKPYGYRTEWTNDDRELIIKPNAALAHEEEYTVSIENGALIVTDVVEEIEETELPKRLEISRNFVVLE